MKRFVELHRFFCGESPLYMEGCNRLIYAVAFPFVYVRFMWIALRSE